MSKYIYTTIYEEFTGLKPPEPKNHKPRRRRGYGHPYRMRLNMQEDGQPEEILDEADAPEEDLQPHTFMTPSSNRSDIHKPTIYRSPRGRQISTSPSQSRPMQYSPMMSEATHKTEPAPKITYKKRRQYNEASASALLSD
ncbi:hypothetical protein ACH42_09530 [Endozoicomonas sp. (ex Bugula neritina AB1)]|nr:hypothetical protein ACH42_09530 [Endozoicomonas sp. (ex Bugula neritina AB1)]